MRLLAIIGVVLIVVGIVVLVSGGFTYTTHENAVNVGPFHATVARRKTIPVPGVVGGLCVVAGLALFVSGSRKR